MCVAMAAGYAALTKLLTRDGSTRMNALGDRLRERLNALAGKAWAADGRDRLRLDLRHSFS